MLLREIANAAPGLVELVGNDSINILSICSDSRRIQPRSLFFCVPGMHFDAHDYAPEAVASGAIALVVDHKLPLDVPQIVVDDVRNALSYMAAAFYGNPAKHLTMIGITGTKGKTTTSFLLHSILKRMGKKAGLIGTVCCIIDELRISSNLTTPDPIEFQQLLRKMVDSGVTHVVMEVSAHALAMNRIAGVLFEAVAFTNLSQDHLDYFHTMESYLDAKMRLFEGDMCRQAAYNCDDASALARFSDRKATRVGISHNADVFARDIEMEERGCKFKLTFHKRFQIEVGLNLPGAFNVDNALMAATLADMVGATPEQIREGLEEVRSVPGRVEPLDTDTPFCVILDYAHAPAALDNVLRTLRKTCNGRLITLFGCGGDRDHAKRPQMGEIGSMLSDYVILTSDNPRSEDPFEIIKAVEAGMKSEGCDYTVIENRREAILYGLKMAREKDILVLAGKGHETYQEINGVKHPFDEKIVVAQLLADHKAEIEAAWAAQA